MTETLSPALPADLEALVMRTLREACDRDLTLATAESCTGGLLASLLTDVDGCGHAFDRGFVVYTNAAKAELLGVPRLWLDNPGPVSEVVARAMAEGAIAGSEADLAVAITGFAGPGGPDDTPGLVHFAVSRRGGPTTHRVEHFRPAARGPVRLASLRVALEMLAAAMA
ncbi:MAG: competence/damage-inducible protein CinA C-terminal domain protein [Caulobacter sp.]|nr:competence/damage-inducible protein CinA C-terminal domain protein [Caulobacter sp.]